ncbi:MAG: hypothetical protein ABH881_01390 [bacterium]
MSKKNVSLIVSGAGWIGSLASGIIVEARRRGIDDACIHALVKEGKASDALIVKVVNAIFDQADTSAASRREWQKFYKEVFGLEVDFSGVKIPENSNQFLNFLQFMPAGLTYEYVHNVEKKQYSKCWDWDKNWPSMMDMSKEERTTEKSYAIWHSGSYEADEIYKEKSANWIAEQGILTMTRMERGIFGLFAWWKHKAMIDQKNVTLCSGSRDSDGGVPRADFRVERGRFGSDWCPPLGAYGFLCSRPVVSC